MWTLCPVHGTCRRRRVWTLSSMNPMIVINRNGLCKLHNDIAFWAHYLFVGTQKQAEGRMGLLIYFCKVFDDWYS